MKGCVPFSVIRAKKSRGCPRLIHGDRGGSRRPQNGNLQPAAFLRFFGAASPLPAFGAAFLAGFSEAFFGAAFSFFFAGLSWVGATGAAVNSTSCISAIS